ncbi:MAG: flagellar biosynthesis protein FlhB [Pseudobdellovibrionaceae bacterium]|nr:flagellar biosynthesis protein FlhB [Bdellovibrionales bacterium]USN47334.1 MAG: flagellar biosynthesis protein FlhB [Pseudobdellovibrionaceae bacterium]
MAESDQGEKTEEATQQRREDFRKRGQVAQTKELGSVLALLGTVGAVWLLGRFFFTQVYEVFFHSFDDFIALAARDNGMLPAMKFALDKSFLMVAPFMGLMWLASFASSILQVGFLQNEEAMQFKLDRLDPIQGLKRIFSLRSLVEGIKAVFKVIIVGFIAYLVIESEVMTLPQLVNYSVPQMFVYLGEVLLKLMGGVGFFMVALAGLDFLFQKWDLEQQMKMTKQEVKEELKSREGDPLIKARIRRVQREMANKRMMEAVPKADVIITNPTHIAVALQYSAEMVAPKVVAMGAGFIAERIKELAREHKVPVIENKPLARTMYKTLKIGQAVPRELYKAVAEVLSYVFKLKRKRK